MRKNQIKKETEKDDKKFGRQEQKVYGEKESN